MKKQIKNSSKILSFPSLILMLLLTPLNLSSQLNNEPIRLGVAGLSHDHVHWILGRQDQTDLKIVGIVEPNKELVARHAKHYGFSMDLVFDTLEEMIAETQPQAVAAFGSIYEHLAVVEACAPKGVHVMVEKPLAVSMDHAFKMKSLAEKYNIHLLTNYETSWYATNHKANEIVQAGKIGDLRKIVVHDGHKGPKEIGVSKEFLEWLTDPKLNGAGALTDFGCYGANLITWLTKGQKPEAVMALAQTFKPDTYPNVDDEATIILQFPKMQGIIQASWNWPFSRKDMEVYGSTGYVISENATEMTSKFKADKNKQKDTLNPLTNPYRDPFALLAAVINNEITLQDYDLPALANNMIVVEILEAAKESVRTGKWISLK
ncbi:oxidoreductase [Arenibacter sp. H213]|uniref:Gfo/Idh/MocA family protein n=2 Tax=Flavobacteriaceae TaxID=49546 RepID=A0ABW5VM17_9FLAO|nr:oxidoreductase [Arenibacter sp. H213]